MSKTISNRFIRLWEKGLLYIILASIVYAVYSLSTNVGVMDWRKELTYFNYIKTSLVDYNMFPYLWWEKLNNIDWYPAISATAVFIAIPETPVFSPIIPLIMIMSVVGFIKLYMFLIFIIGVVGVVKLKKRLNWNDIQFRTYCTMYLFSPIIMQHLAIGFSPWINLFLFPWFIYFLAEKKVMKSAIGIAGTLALALLQGGIYIFIWFMMIFLLYSLISLITERNWEIALRIILVPLFALLLALVRIYSTANAYADFTRVWFETNGYNPFNFLFYALIPTVTIEPIDLLFWTDLFMIGIPQHDGGIFWGLIVIMVLVMVFRFKEIFKKDKKSQSRINYKAMFFTATIIFIFSFFSVWAAIMRTIQSLIYLPFFESIKNYGFRWAIPAYLGFTLVLANNIEKIWLVLSDWLKTKIWINIKTVAIILFKVAVLGLGVVWLVLLFLKNQILDQFKNVISIAFNGEAFAFIRNRMEGMDQKNLEFYFLKAENLYSVIQQWILITFIFLFMIVVFALIFKINRNKTAIIIEKYPFLKFEMLLAIPLLFSMSMWTKLAISVPYSDFPVQTVESPTVIVGGDSLYSVPKISVTPKEMIIKQEVKKQPYGYKFPKILARDSKYLLVKTKNAVLFSVQNELMIKPLDNEEIIVTFKTKTINRTLLITLISWLGSIIFFIVSNLRSKKLRDS